MTHSIRAEGDAAGPVVVVVGDADASASADIEAAIAKAVDKYGPGLVVVDLTEVSFLDSRTMGVLVRWSERLRASDGRLPLICTDPRLRKLFGLIGLEQSFEFHESRSAALGSG